MENEVSYVWKFPLCGIKPRKRLWEKKNNLVEERKGKEGEKEKKEKKRKEKKERKGEKEKKMNKGKKRRKNKREEKNRARRERKKKKENDFDSQCSNDRKLLVRELKLVY